MRKRQRFSPLEGTTQQRTFCPLRTICQVQFESFRVQMFILDFVSNNLAQSAFKFTRIGLVCYSNENKDVLLIGRDDQVRVQSAFHAFEAPCRHLH